MPTATISEKKRAANRANARKSTGPRTPEGKARSSLNAISHGLFCKDLVLPGESREVFDLLHRGWIASLNPQDLAELWLVDRIVAASWKLRRLQETESLLHQTDGHELLGLKDAEDELNGPISRDQRGDDSRESNLSPLPPEMILSVQLSCQEEELPRSPFLDDELPLTPSPRNRGEGRGEGPDARDCQSAFDDTEPLSPTLSPEYRGEGVSTRTSKMKNEPTADRDGAAGKGESSAVARAARPCSASKTKPNNTKASPVSCPPHLRVVGSAAS